MHRLYKILSFIGWRFYLTLPQPRFHPGVCRTMKQAIVIGAGIGGLSTALRLRARGYAVDVYEANSYPGGKLSSFAQDGYRFDAGPSLFTMPHLVTELFDLFGERAEDHFSFIRKEEICNYFWEDGTRFTVPADREKFIEQAVARFDVSEQKLKKYLESAARKYELTAPLFLEKSLHRLGTYLNTTTLKAMLQLGGMDIGRSLDATNRAYFDDPKLVQLFNRYATYNGSSPYRTPGIMSMIPHLEMHYGTFFPKGGMVSITESLYQLALRQGIQFHFGQSVDKILVENRRAVGVQVNGTPHSADLVVSNMDIFSSYRKLLSDQPAPERTLKQERSSSALIFYWGVQGNFPELDLHNIFFTEDYPAEFACLFDRKTLYHDPTVYVHISSKEEPGDAPAGGENWFVMINAPGNYEQDWNTLIDRAREHILDKLERNLGADLRSKIVTEAILDPRSIESRTSSYRGALYGAASNDRFAAFLRHPNFTRKIKDLYFCGGSVHPGGGIPLCLLSGKIVGDLVPPP